MKSIQSWLNEYALSHQHSSNIRIHWICVPLIFFSITGFLFLLTIPVLGNLAIPALVLLTIYYSLLSRTLWIGMFIFSTLCLAGVYIVFIHLFNSSLYFFLIVFILAWIGQFAGHKIEGKKPSFLKDIQFLLIGPAWLMSKIYKSMGISI